MTDWTHLFDDDTADLDPMDALRGIACTLDYPVTPPSGLGPITVDVAAILTTDHHASSCGIPVLVVTGNTPDWHPVHRGQALVCGDLPPGAGVRIHDRAELYQADGPTEGAGMDGAVDLAQRGGYPVRVVGSLDTEWVG